VPSTDVTDLKGLEILKRAKLVGHFQGAYESNVGLCEIRSVVWRRE
jgi:hypothetical protein